MEDFRTKYLFDQLIYLCISLYFHHFRPSINLEIGLTFFIFFRLTTHFSDAVAANWFNFIFKLSKKKTPIQFIYRMETLHH